MKRLGIIFAMMFWMWGGGLAAQEIDRLLAAVNGRVITDSDFRTARTLRAILELGQTEEMPPRKEELDRLIVQELIRQEMENFPIGQAERDSIEKKIQEQMANLKNIYAEIGGLPALLRQLGLKEEELTSHLRLIALTAQFMDLRFRPFLTAADTEELRQKLNAAMDQWIENIRAHSKIEFFAEGIRVPESGRP